MRLAISLLSLAAVTALFAWASGTNENHEAAGKGDCDNHGAE